MGTAPGGAPHDAALPGPGGVAIDGIAMVAAITGWALCCGGAACGGVGCAPGLNCAGVWHCGQYATPVAVGIHTVAPQR